MKNICFLNTVEFWGGGEKLFLDSAKYFKSKGYNILVVAAPESPLLTKSNNEGIKTQAIKGGNKAFLSLSKRKKLKKFFIANQIDTLIVINSHDVKFGGLVAKQAKVKRIVYQRGLAAPVKGSFLNKYLFKKVFTHLIVNSNATKETMLVNLKDKQLNEKVKVVYHGIPTTEIDAHSMLKEFPFEEETLLIGNAGRLTKQKGHKYLIEVAEELKNRQLSFKIVIAGTGELKEQLQESIDRKKLKDHVYLLGFIENMDAFMNSIDIFALSSLWEGFGFAITEAMIKEKPVVAFNLSSNPEIIENNQTGFLIDYPNIEDFADKIEELIKNPTLRKELGEKGKERVVHYFSETDRLNELEEYLLNN